MNQSRFLQFVYDMKENRLSMIEGLISMSFSP